MLNIVISTFFKTFGMVAIAKFSWGWLFVSSGEYFFLEYIFHNFTWGCLHVLLKFSKYILLKFWMNLSAYIFFRFEYLEKWLIVLLSFLSWSCARGAKISIFLPLPPSNPIGSYISILHKPGILTLLDCLDRSKSAQSRGFSHCETSVLQL